MQIIDMSVGWTLTVNVLAWTFFHIIISLALEGIPARQFIHDNNLLQIQPWENNGQLWERLFRVKSWKHLIIDGTIIIPKGFEKKKLASKNTEYLQRFLMESRRAEVTHWISMLPAPLFFLWNPGWVGWLMIVYAILFNAPIIIVQRYNRPRLKKIIERKDWDRGKL